MKITSHKDLLTLLNVNENVNIEPANPVENIRYRKADSQINNAIHSLYVLYNEANPATIAKLNVIVSTLKSIKPTDIFKEIHK